jgi:glycosyltransferase involved in cell wall biosynthesis
MEEGAIWRKFGVCFAAASPKFSGNCPLKVAVYAIALNEAVHVDRWAGSAIDADYRVVADTGSTDDTVKRLEKAGVTVHKIAIRPWRFDDARNAALALVPADADLCITMDMDEFLEPGWRSRLEAAWTPGTTAIWCRKAWHTQPGGPPLFTVSAKKIHSRWGYRCKRAVHEALFFTGEREVTHTCDDIVISEIQDPGKETRKQYLPLLEIAHQEDPGDSQICFWLGREYMWTNQPERAIELLRRYLALPTSTWGDERSEAMRYLARMQPERKMVWLDKARIEGPHRREIWLDLAEELHNQSDWLNLFWACANGIDKTHRTDTYLDDSNCWGFRLYDLGAIAAWHLDMMDRAVEWGQKALELATDGQAARLKDNLDFFIRRRDLQAQLPHNGGTTKAPRLRAIDSSMANFPKSLLLRRTRALGDVIMATPVLACLRYRLGPGAVIDIETYYPSVFHSNPNINCLRKPGEVGSYDKVINLNLAYELRPQMHAIDAYLLEASLDTEWPNKSAFLYKTSISELPSLAWKRAVAIHAAKTWQSRTLPRHFWSSVIAQLISADFVPIILGSGEDFSWPSEDGVVDLVGRLDLHQIATLIELCACFLGNDSGLLHVAGTTSTPIVGLYTSVRPEYRMPWREGILGWRTTPLVPALECVGCLADEPTPANSDGCRRGDYACVNDGMVSPSAAVDAVRAWVEAG